MFSCDGFSCTWEDMYGGGAAIKGYLDTDVFSINGWPTLSAVPVGVITEVDGLDNFETVSNPLRGSHQVKINSGSWIHPVFFSDWCRRYLGICFPSH